MGGWWSPSHTHYRVLKSLPPVVPHVSRRSLVGAQQGRGDHVFAFTPLDGNQAGLPDPRLGLAKHNLLLLGRGEFRSLLHPLLSPVPVLLLPPFLLLLHIPHPLPLMYPCYPSILSSFSYSFSSSPCSLVLNSFFFLSLYSFCSLYTSVTPVSFSSSSSPSTAS